MTLPESRRLRRLNRAQPTRPWSSATELRHCILCTADFTGRDVVERPEEGARARLACPVCGSAAEFWVRPGNPLLDAVAWTDWNEAMERFIAMEEPAERAPAQAGRNV